MGAAKAPWDNVGMSEKERSKLRHRIDQAMRKLRRSQGSGKVAILQQSTTITNLAPGSNRKPIDIWLWIGGVVVAFILFLIPQKTSPVVIASMVVMFALLIHPVWNFWWIEKTMWRRVPALIVLMCSLAAFARYTWPVPQLHISIGFNMKSDSRETSGGLWVTREDYVAPINSAVLVRIVNASDVYAPLESFSLSLGNAKTDKWAELTSITAAGKLYCCTDNKSGLNQMHEILLDGGGLFRILQNGGVPPRAQITNWLLFEYPKGFVPDASESVKLSFWDEARREYRMISGPSTAESSKAVFDARNDVKDELDKLTMKAVYNPIVSLLQYRTSHISDEKP